MEIVNLYKLSKIECSSVDVVFVGRNSEHYKAKFGFTRSLPVLANPYRVGVDGIKGECVLKYHRWLVVKIKAKDQAIISAILTLKDTDKLACFCSDPNGCHASIIIRAYNYLKEINGKN